MCLIGQRGVLHIHLRRLLIVRQQVLASELGDIRVETTQFLLDTLNAFVDEVGGNRRVAHLVLLPFLLIHLYQRVQNGFGSVAVLIFVGQTDDTRLVVGQVDLQLFQTVLHLIVFPFLCDADGPLVVIRETFREILRLDYRHFTEWRLTYFTHFSVDLAVELVFVLSELIQRKRAVLLQIHLHVASVLLRQLWEGHLDG